MQPALKELINRSSTQSVSDQVDLLKAYVSKNPKDSEGFYLLGQIQTAGRLLEDAHASLQRAVQLRKNHPLFMGALADICQKLGNFSDACAWYARVLQVKPGDMAALKRLINLNNNSVEQSEQVQSAINGILQHFKSKIGPEDNDNLNELKYIEILDIIGDTDGAIKAYESMPIKFSKDYRVVNNLGLLYSRIGRKEDAVEKFKIAIELEPNLAGLHLNLGETYNSLRLKDEAVDCLNHSVSLDPSLIEAYMNLASIHWRENRHELALENCDKAISLNPSFGGAYNLKGIVLTSIAEHEDAMVAFAKAINLNPENPAFFSNYLLTANYCEWIPCKELYQYHLGFGKRYELGKKTPLKVNKDPLRKLRIGFISSDLTYHSVSFFFEPLLSFIDHSKVDIYVYSNVAHPDPMTNVLKEKANVWRNVYGIKANGMDRLIRSDSIDILIDLAGHTGYNFLPLLLKKPAPIQVSWLGYPNTTGLNCVDYRISDDITEPVGEGEQLSSEKIVRLAEGFHAFRLPEGVSETVKSPFIENGYITFGSFNNSAKITPHVIRKWSELLLKVEGSRLVLKNGGFMHKGSRAKILKQFVSCGLSEERIEFLDRTKSMKGHLNSYHQIDVALDTFPYNGTTTTVEALFMGVPVLSFLGDRHASRVSGSIIHQVGLADWVAKDEASWVENSFNCLSDLNYLDRTRATLRDRFKNSSIADYKNFAYKFVHALREMWWNYCTEEGVDPMLTDQLREELDFETQRIESRTVARSGYFAEVKGLKDEAIKLYEKAYLLSEDNSFVLKRLGSLYSAKNEIKLSIEAYRKYLQTNHQDDHAWADLGSAYQANREYCKAVGCFENSLCKNSLRYGVRLNLAATLMELHEFTEAENNLKKVIDVVPDQPHAWNNLGKLYKETGRFELAVDAFVKSIRGGGGEIAHSNLLMCLNYVPGMSEKELDENHIIWCDNNLGERGNTFSSESIYNRPDKKKIRVGYVSSDLHNHPVSRFLLPVLKNHSHEKFSVILFDDSKIKDSWNNQIAEFSEKKLDVNHLNNDDLAELIKGESIDVLVELNGHTSNNRLAIFEQRLAPLQLSWIGYPRPSLIPQIDAFISDSYIMAGYKGTAKTWLLENGAHVHEFPEALPVEIGSSEIKGHVTFGSFNQTAKLNEKVIDLWARILNEVPKSQLYLKARQFSNAEQIQRIRERFIEHGISEDRILLEARVSSQKEHLEKLNDIDIALDPFPYNGVCTTCDALWMGTPVVTLEGETLSGRYAGSLLKQIGRDEWIGEDEDHYLQIAVRLANDEVGRKEIKSKLRSELINSSLFTAKPVIKEYELMILEHLKKNKITQSGIASQIIKNGS